MEGSIGNSCTSLSLEEIGVELCLYFPQDCCPQAKWVADWFLWIWRVETTNVLELLTECLRLLIPVWRPCQSPYKLCSRFTGHFLSPKHVLDSCLPSFSCLEFAWVEHRWKLSSPDKQKSLLSLSKLVLRCLSAHHAVVVRPGHNPAFHFSHLWSFWDG